MKVVDRRGPQHGERARQVASSVQKQQRPRARAQRGVGSQGEENQELEWLADVHLDDAAAMLRERKVQVSPAQPEEAQAGTTRELPLDVVIDRPARHLERSRRRVN